MLKQKNVFPERHNAMLADSMIHLENVLLNSLNIDRLAAVMLCSSSF